MTKLEAGYHKTITGEMVYLDRTIYAESYKEHCNRIVTNCMKSHLICKFGCAKDYGVPNCEANIIDGCNGM